MYPVRSVRDMRCLSWILRRVIMHCVKPQASGLRGYSSTATLVSLLTACFCRTAAQLDRAGASRARCCPLVSYEEYGSYLNAGNAVEELQYARFQINIPGELYDIRAIITTTRTSKVFKSTHGWDLTIRFEAVYLARVSSGTEELSSGSEDRSSRPYPSPLSSFPSHSDLLVRPRSLSIPVTIPTPAALKTPTIRSSSAASRVSLPSSRKMGSIPEIS
ncbi:hypothetical protein NM688_g1555 [Phlebia brevispora]|uniref:Uncharacterized protein n=1 Tax=Phlebia brevispora TaxID=194682 RepID=A0ACC1TB59_9APHY|nr:hypothetical protein NM688_g1555 [Phlebia brevispora]